MRMWRGMIRCFGGIAGCEGRPLGKSAAAARAIQVWRGSPPDRKGCARPAAGSGGRGRPARSRGTAPPSPSPHDGGVNGIPS